MTTSTVSEALAKRFNMERTDATEAQLIEALIAESLVRKALERDPKWRARQAPDAWAAAAQAQEEAKLANEQLNAARGAISQRARDSASRGVKLRQDRVELKRQAVAEAVDKLRETKGRMLRKTIADQANAILRKNFNGSLPDGYTQFTEDNVRKYLRSPLF